MVSQHVSDYFHSDDSPRRRNLPAEKVAAIERVYGNTAIVRALQGPLATVLFDVKPSDMSATAAAAALLFVAAGAPAQ